MMLLPPSALHIFVQLHGVFQMFYCNFRLLKHFERIRLVMVVLFADHAPDSAVDYEHGARPAGGHFAVDRAAVNGNAAFGRLTNCILLGVYGADAMLRNAAVRMNRLPHQVSNLIAVRKSRRRTNIACNQNLVIAGNYAPRPSPSARRSLGNSPRRFHKILIPCRPDIFFVSHIPLLFSKNQGASRTRPALRSSGKRVTTRRNPEKIATSTIFEMPLCNHFMKKDICCPFERLSVASRKTNRLICCSLGHLGKIAFCDFFSRLRRVVTRWIIASYNIAFSKLPLKTEVFRGSLLSITRKRRAFSPFG